MTTVGKRADRSATVGVLSCFIEEAFDTDCGSAFSTGVEWSRPCFFLPIRTSQAHAVRDADQTQGVPGPMCRRSLMVACHGRTISCRCGLHCLVTFPAFPSFLFYRGDPHSFPSDYCIARPPCDSNLVIFLPGRVCKRDRGDGGHSPNEIQETSFLHMANIAKRSFLWQRRNLPLMPT